MKSEWTLSELAEETGLPARTIRYYIARGLLAGPAVAGRGAVYGAQHLARLQEIQALQRDGRMLAEIAVQSSGEPEQQLPAPVPWQEYVVAEGITVNVRADLAPWRLKRVRKALAEFAARLRDEKDEKDEKEEMDGNQRV
jgi:DNA-binding transcriptional MerR regulator